MSAVDLRPVDAPEPVPGDGAGGRAPKSATRSLIELGTVVTVIVVVALAAGQGALLLVVACLVVMIMVHELGHFLAAKHGNMKVTEYFLGFGPGSGRSVGARRSTG